MMKFGYFDDRLKEYVKETGNMDFLDLMVRNI
jgi:hypothetical protein